MQQLFFSSKWNEKKKHTAEKYKEQLANAKRKKLNGHEQNVLIAIYIENKNVHGTKYKAAAKPNHKL